MSPEVYIPLIISIAAFAMSVISLWQSAKAKKTTLMLSHIENTSQVQISNLELYPEIVHLQFRLRSLKNSEAVASSLGGILEMEGALDSMLKTCQEAFVDMDELRNDSPSDQYNLSLSDLIAALNEQKAALEAGKFFVEELERRVYESEQESDRT